MAMKMRVMFGFIDGFCCIGASHGLSLVHPRLIKNEKSKVTQIFCGTTHYMKRGG